MVYGSGGPNKLKTSTYSLFEQMDHSPRCLTGPSSKQPFYFYLLIPKFSHPRPRILSLHNPHYSTPSHHDPYPPSTKFSSYFPKRSYTFLTHHTSHTDPHQSPTHPSRKAAPRSDAPGDDSSTSKLRCIKMILGKGKGGGEDGRRGIFMRFGGCTKGRLASFTE